MVLSILIPTIKKHWQKFTVLAQSLHEQIMRGNYLKYVEVIYDPDENLTTGAKRNNLLKEAKGKYVVFVDSDDTVTDNYISAIMGAIKNKPDAIGFKGWITSKGITKEWKISKNFPYEQKDGIYLRYNNHLSPVKREIALQIGYPDKTYGEDFDYAKRLHESGLVKTEVYIDKHLYNYNYVSK